MMNSPSTLVTILDNQTSLPSRFSTPSFLSVLFISRIIFQSLFIVVAIAEENAYSSLVHDVT